MVSAIVGDDLEAVLVASPDVDAHDRDSALHGLEVLRPTLNDVFLGATKDEP